MGAQRIADYLLRKKVKFSAMTVWRVLKKHQVKVVVKRRKKSDYIRYSKKIPGERVLLEVIFNKQWRIKIYRRLFYAFKLIVWGTANAKGRDHPSRRA